MRQGRPVIARGCVVRRVCVLGATGLLCSLLTPLAEAATPLTPESAASPAVSEPSAVMIQPVRRRGFELVRDPGWGLGLSAHTGLSVLNQSGGMRAHAVVGGALRVRYSYVQLGVLVEGTDDAAGERWRALGGTAGIFLPYRKWLDMTAEVGVSQRAHRDSDPRYGADGYRVDTPALTLRVGASDRTSGSLFGARLGGELFCAIDLSRKTRSWEYGGSESVPPTRGTTRVGGVSLGIGVTVAFDLAQIGE